MDASNDVDLQPDVPVVLQEEDPAEGPAIPVCVREISGPVRTQVLPRKLATSQTRTMTTTVARVLRADHYRASATIVSKDQPIYIAFNEASAQDTSTMALLPVNTLYTHTATTDVWISSSTATTSVSIITERWATGE